MNKYSFTITIEGEGTTPEEGWENALLDLALHSLDMPEYQVIESED